MDPNEQTPAMEIGEWLKMGIDNGWCSDITCVTHDANVYTDEEMDLWDEGEDPCAFVVRIMD